MNAEEDSSRQDGSNYRDGRNSDEKAGQGNRDQGKIMSAEGTNVPRPRYAREKGRLERRSQRKEPRDGLPQVKEWRTGRKGACVTDVSAKGAAESSTREHGEGEQGEQQRRQRRPRRSGDQSNNRRRSAGRLWRQRTRSRVKEQTCLAQLMTGVRGSVEQNSRQQV